MRRSLRRPSDNAMLIRSATPEDITKIMNLAEQAETAAHWGEREYKALFDPDTPRRVALVACKEQTSEVSGFVIARCEGEDWEIENVVVEPKWRRQGIGGELIRVLLSRARQEGAVSVLLEVRESNTAARELYAKWGFREEGRRRAYYRNPEEDALVLRMLV